MKPIIVSGFTNVGNDNCSKQKNLDEPQLSDIPGNQASSAKTENNLITVSIDEMPNSRSRLEILSEGQLSAKKFKLLISDSISTTGILIKNKKFSFSGISAAAANVKSEDV